VAKGNDEYQKAVRKSRSTVAATKLCETAISHYKKAYNSLNELVEKFSDDEHLSGEAQSIGQEIHDNGIRAALQAANMLCIQSDYKGAMDWTQRILAFDPQNAEAKQMAQTITMAQATASDDWAWGWTIGHIGQVGQGPVGHPRNR
jgi:hypothetical protein